MTVGTLALVAVLWVGSSEKYVGYEDFLKQHHTTLSALCKKHKATSCVLIKERVGVLDSLGLASESGTMQWNLYGKPVAGKAVK